MHKKHGHAHAKAAWATQIHKTSSQPPLSKGPSINDDSKGTRTPNHTPTAAATERQLLALLYLALYPVRLHTHRERENKVDMCVHVPEGSARPIRPEQKAEPSVFLHSVGDIYGYVLLAKVPTGWLADTRARPPCNTKRGAGMH